MKEQDIPTPALVIDLATAERNIARMQTYAAAHGLAVRPHTKTHKSIRMGKLQMATGAAGLTVAKAGEARVMAEASADLMVGYPAWDPARAPTIAQLATRCTMRIALDSELSVERIAAAARSAGSTVGVLVDLDTGMRRTGLQTPEQTLDLARHVERTTGVRLDGLFTYQGNITGSAEQVRQQLEEAGRGTRACLDLWARHGLEAPIVSGGSTPTAFLSHHNDALTEIRPGTYVYYDRGNILGGGCTLDDCAARVTATVVSNAVPGKAVLDCGNKTLAMDLIGGDPARGHGLIVEYPDARLDYLTEEHGRIDISACDRAPRLGERVQVVPNHVCVCVNLQNQVWFRNADGTVEAAPVDARGLLT